MPLLLLYLFLGVAPVFAQAPCPSIDFLSARQFRTSLSRTYSVFYREADLSYGLYPHLRSLAPYTRSEGARNAQQLLMGCLPMPPAAGPALVINGDWPGAPARAKLYSRNVGNGTSLAAWRSFSGSILIAFSGNSDYSYRSQSNIDFGNRDSRSGIAGADYDGDGNFDMAVLFSPFGPGVTSRIGILKGRGDGTFQSPVFLSTPHPQTVSFTQADINRDGRPDFLIPGSANGGSVATYLGNADGTFTAGPLLAVPAGSPPSAVTVGDFNGDSFPDLIVTSNQAPAASSVIFYAGSASGTFAAPRVLRGIEGGTYAVAVDVNRDNRLDLAVLASNAGVLAVMLGQGDGTFRAPVLYATQYGTQAITPADLNGDGNMDLVLSQGNAEVILPNENSDYLWAFFGRGDGTFVSAPLLDPGVDPQRILARDLNGDGRPDLLVNGFRGTALLVGQADGTFQVAANATNLPRTRANDFALGDLNRDGKPDLAVADTNLSVYLGAATGLGFGAPTSTTLPARASGVAVADFDGDGRDDVVATYNNQVPGAPPASNGFSLFLSSAAGVLGAGTATLTGGVPATAAAADLNGDGRPDLIVLDQGSRVPSNTFNGRVLVYYNSGNAANRFSSPTVLNPSGYPVSISIGDLNGDGRPDLVFTLEDASFRNFVGVALNQGATMGAPSLIRTDFGPRAAQIADLNGDGRLDLYIPHCCGDTQDGLMVGNGDGTFQAEQFLQTGSNSAIAVDLDGDRKTDIVQALNAGLSILKNISPAPPPFVAVNAATNRLGPVAIDSLVTLYGARFAPALLQASTLPLPTDLGGTNVTIRDSVGTEVAAPLILVSPGQINLHLPANLKPGYAQIIVNAPDGTRQQIATELVRLAPGLFQLNAARLAAALIVRIGTGGTQTIENVYDVNPAGAVIPRAIDFGPTTDRLVLILYGTGLRNRFSAQGFENQITVGQTACSIDYAGPQNEYVGFDQINCRLSRSLIGQGDVDVVANLAGAASNAVQLRFR